MNEDDLELNSREINLPKEEKQTGGGCSKIGWIIVYVVSGALSLLIIFWMSNIINTFYSIASLLEKLYMVAKASEPILITIAELLTKHYNTTGGNMIGTYNKTSLL